MGPLHWEGEGGAVSDLLPDLLVFAWQPVLQNRNIFSWPPEHARETPSPCTQAHLSPCRATSWLIACILAIAIRAATATKTAVDLRSKRTVASCLCPPCWHIPATLLLLARAWQEQDTIFKTKSMFCALLSCPKREEWRKRITALDRRTFLPSPALLHPLTLTLTLRLHLKVVPACPTRCLAGLLHFIDLSQPA